MTSALLLRINVKIIYKPSSENAPCVSHAYKTCQKSTPPQLPLLYIYYYSNGNVKAKKPGGPIYWCAHIYIYICLSLSPSLYLSLSL